MRSMTARSKHRLTLHGRRSLCCGHASVTEWLEAREIPAAEIQAIKRGAPQLFEAGELAASRNIGQNLGIPQSRQKKGFFRGTCNASDGF